MKNDSVTPEEFVAEFWLLKQQYLAAVTTDEQLTTNNLLKKLNLTEEQRPVFAELLDAVLTDVLYTVLLGLDGAAQIGNRQEIYSVFDDCGNKICGEMGEVETLAYEYFHNSKQ